MNDQKQNNNNNLHDLTGSGVEETQIKGGPTPKSKRTLLLKSSVAEQNSVTGDLEPTAEVKGGGWGYSESTIKLNHNQTLTRVAGDEDKTQTVEFADSAALEDLEPDGDVVGGVTDVIKPKRPVFTGEATP